MAGVPFAQQKVEVVGGLGFLTRRTIAILEDAGREVGLNLVDGVGQGSFCPGCVGKSEGTHDKGGVFDLRGKLGLAVPKVEKALRERGVAAWIRLPPTFPLHIHGVDAFDPDLSDAAKGQVKQYEAGTDGLAGHRKDTDRPHPTLRRFPDPMEDAMTPAQEAKLDDLVDRVKLLQQRTVVNDGGESIEIDLAVERLLKLVQLLQQRTVVNDEGESIEIDLAVERLLKLVRREFAPEP